MTTQHHVTLTFRIAWWFVPLAALLMLASRVGLTAPAERAAQWAIRRACRVLPA